MSVDFVVSDIMDLPLERARGCDFTFTDPPWEQGLVKMFETLAHRDAGLERPGNDIDAILKQLFTLAPLAPCFVEYSVKGHERVIAAGKERGHVHSWTLEAVQTTGKPYVIVAFNTRMPKPQDTLQGWEFLEKAMEFHKPARVFEPFAGHGQHTRRMVKHGARVIASELNPARAQKLKDHFGL